MPETLTRTVLTERTAPLQYVKESGTNAEGKTYLGKLAGIGADFTKPTRNGRRYPLELWKNVLNSDDFKEGMATHTIFGENDHPEERIDTSIKEISIVLTECEIREAEGIVYVEFDILDTPQGRILKSLLDYGSQIGVSSRGLGDEKVVGGETIIDPDTYQFFAWDAVVMPAVITARPKVIESVSKSNLTEQFHKEISAATTKAELESIQRIAENTKLPELDSIKESINIKLEDLEGKNISAKLEDELGNLAKENEDLKSEIESLKAKLSAKDIRLTEVKDLLKQVKETSRDLSKQLQDSKRSEAYYQDQIFDSAAHTNQICEDYDNHISNLRHKLSESKHNIAKLEKTNAQLVESNNEIIAKSKRLKAKYENKLSEMQIENDKLVAQLNESTDKINNISEDKKLVESNTKSNMRKMQEKLDMANKTCQQVIAKYLENKCSQYNITKEAVIAKLPQSYTTEDIDKVVSELAAKQDRINKLPIAVPKRASIKLSEVRKYSEEDAQTMRMIEATSNSSK